MSIESLQQAPELQEKERSVDMKIGDVAAELNALGVNATSSWEGAIDDRPHVAAPYIEVRSKDIEEIETHFESVHGQSGENASAAEALLPEIIEKNLEERAKLISLLDAFYTDRHTSFTDRLIIVDSDGRATSRLVNQGAGLQVVASPKERLENLGHFQNEMRAFGQFLKERSEQG